MARLLAALLALTLLGGIAAAEPAAERLALLRRGVNVTNWFRFPPSRNPEVLRAYLDDRAIRDLKGAGFTFIRLPVQPEVLASPGVPGALADVVARLERHGLAVVVVLHPAEWRLETSAADRANLITTWARLAPLLRRFNPALTFAEVLNEPVFPNAAAAWGRLQHEALAAIRSVLPDSTVVLTGSDWGGVAGLLALVPEVDRNVIYSFHLYEPPELTALGAYRAGIDANAMARLPFPVDAAACRAVAEGVSDVPTADLMRFYCAQGWDASRLKAEIGKVATWARRHHAALLAGEFGASQRLNAPARLAWLTTVREACDQQSIGWALWGYDDSMGFGEHPPSVRRPLDPLVLRALGLPEPVRRK